jgi:hypothetical protein
MTKRQHGNKELKKPKRPAPPVKPPATGISPASLDVAMVAPRTRPR